jgi:mannose-6-phosphate isomerase-like protein (cupin superfamily)
MLDQAFWGRTADHRGAFFRVIHSTKRSQVAMMTVPAGQEAGAPETHAGADQVLLVLEGKATAKVWSAGPQRPPVERRLEAGGILVVPGGMQHWVRSDGPGDLVLFTVYAPPAY